MAQLYTMQFLKPNYAAGLWIVLRRRFDEPYMEALETQQSRFNNGDDFCYFDEKPTVESVGLAVLAGAYWDFSDWGMESIFAPTAEGTGIEAQRASAVLIYDDELPLEVTP